MSELITTKKAARAIGASESSVKRWCDKGVISAQYTAGGHRRIAVADLLAFLKESKHQLIHPEALGLPASTGRSPRQVARATENLREALLAGDEMRSRQITIDLFLAQCSISSLCDDVFAPVMEQIGEMWACDNADVYQERQACQIVLRILHELIKLVPATPGSMPLAIGASAPGDPYTIGSAMAELVLADAQWRTVQLGDNLPFESLSCAIRDHEPNLFWLACTHLADEEAFVTGYQSLYESHGSRVAFVVGGSGFTESIRRRIKYAAFCDNMRHLEEFAQTLNTVRRSSANV